MKRAGGWFPCPGRLEPEIDPHIFMLHSSSLDLHGLRPNFILLPTRFRSVSGFRKQNLRAGGGCLLRGSDP